MFELSWSFELTMLVSLGAELLSHAAANHTPNSLP
jgi:hypothetical protein